jgi:pimeloyl-ACP methyl ester carboxylesterase
MSETYLLVHGAWHAGWCWRPVSTRLRAAGHRVLAPTLPGMGDADDPTRYSLADVVDSVVDLAEREDLTDVVLVGHSWAGYVISAAAPRLAARLSRLVYWSSFVPAEGVPLVGEVPPAVAEFFADLARASGDDTMSLPFDFFQAFIQDAPEETQRLVHSLLSPHPLRYSTTPVAPIDVSRYDFATSYLIGDADLTMGDPDGWRPFAARLGVEPTLIPGSHEAMLTQPKAVAEALLAERAR